MSKRGFNEFSQRTLGKRSRENQLGEVNTEEYRRIRKIVKLNIVRNGMSVKESIRQFKVNSPPQMHVNSVASHASNVNGSSMSKPSNEGTDLWKILEQDLLEEIRIEQEMLQQQYEEQYAEYDDEAMMHDVESYNATNAVHASANNTTHVQYPRGVLCPVCQTRNLMRNGRIFFCSCGMRVDTQHDNISMDYVGDVLRKHVDAHIQRRCSGTPTFSVNANFGGISNLIMQCQACNMYEIVI